MLRWSLIFTIAMFLVSCNERPAPDVLPQPGLPPQVSMLSLGAYDAKGWHPPPNGLVADSETAIRVAQVYLGRLVPADWARDTRNWGARPQGEDQWMVGLSVCSGTY